MAAAAGSLWNANSWHWEEKNYTKWTKEYFEDKLRNFALCESNDSPDNSYTVTVASPPQITGEAAISVRKGKTLRVFDLTLSLCWCACSASKSSNSSRNDCCKSRCNDSGCHESSESNSEKMCSGKILVENLSEESVLDNDYRVTVTLSAVDAETKSSFTEEERNEIRKRVQLQGSHRLHELFQQYIKDLTEAEASAERLKADKKQREDEQKRAELAKAEKGEEKEKIAAAEKAKDLKFKEEEKARAAATTQSQPQRLPQLEGQGSVWNANSYHWEEKPMTAWCVSSLKERLANTEFNLLENSAVLKFFKVSVEGEASNTIRKGKKLVIFDLSISADWTATARDHKGVFLADSRGKVEITDFSSESSDDYSLQICGDGKVPAQERIDNAAQKELPAQLHALLQQFIKDLKARG